MMEPREPAFGGSWDQVAANYTKVELVSRLELFPKQTLQQAD